MFIYYNNNEIYDKIVLKTINNWKNEYKQSIIMKKNNKLKNFVEDEGIIDVFSKLFKKFY